MHEDVTAYEHCDRPPLPRIETVAGMGDDVPDAGPASGSETARAVTTTGHRGPRFQPAPVLRKATPDEFEKYKNKLGPWDRVHTGVAAEPWDRAVPKSLV